MPLLDFLNVDTPRTLFPLESPGIIIGLGAAELLKYLEDHIFVTSDYHFSFVQAPIAFALKDRLYTRRVHLLDPSAILYLYKFVYDNSGLFKAPAKLAPRRRYGLVALRWTC
jgi:hypothetical protein